jgi:hypothetical protein
MSVTLSCISNDQQLPGHPFSPAVCVVYECDELLTQSNYNVTPARSVLKAVVAKTLLSTASCQLEFNAIIVFMSSVPLDDAEGTSLKIG